MPRGRIFCLGEENAGRYFMKKQRRPTHNEFENRFRESIRVGFNWSRFLTEQWPIEQVTLDSASWKRELFPSDAEELIQWICGQGMTPILAHPERFDFFWEDLSRVDVLVEAGAWLQLETVFRNVSRLSMGKRS